MELEALDEGTGSSSSSQGSSSLDACEGVGVCDELDLVGFEEVCDLDLSSEHGDSLASLDLPW